MLDCILHICLVTFELVIVAILYSFFFFFKQKTAYEMRISDWSSDVCSSDLHANVRQEAPDVGVIGEETVGELAERIGVEQRRADRAEFDGSEDTQIGRASCRERVCQYV